MARPRAVQASIDASEAAHKAAYPAPVPDAPPTPSVETPPAAAETSTTVASAGGDPPAKTETVAAPAVGVATPSTDPAPPAQGDELYEHRFKVLQGKYNKEGAEMRAQIRELTTRNSRLEALLATTQVNTPPKPDAVAAATPKLPGVTQEEIDNYGPEFMDMVGRVAEQRVAEHLGKLDAKVGTVANAVTAQADQIKTEISAQLPERLNTLFPGWGQLNTDPKFIGWLNELDPFSGVPRIDLFDRAVEAGNAQRCAQFFRSYVQENATVDPAPTAQPAPTAEAPPARRLNPSQVPMETLAAPGRGRAATPGGTAPAKQLWSGAAVKQFYEDRRRGRIPPERAAAMEQDLFAAMKDGRLSP